MDSSRSNGSLLMYPQLQNVLRIEFARARRYDYPLSCIALAVDRLENLSDLYGAEVMTPRDNLLPGVTAFVEIYCP